MKTANRIALIYGVSLLGAGIFSYTRGRRGQDLLVDAALHGAVAGTALNVVGFLILDSGEVVPVFSSARTNSGMGNTPKGAVELLSTLNPSLLFSDLKENGVKIAAVPENASIVVQDMT